MKESDKSTGPECTQKLQATDASLDLYHRWADRYEQELSEVLGYCYSEQVAARYAEMADAEDGPIVDVGCGTGLLGEALQALGEWPVDGLDISETMLAMAARKGCYRQLLAVDLTAPLSNSDEPWGGLVSAGAYNPGQLGPNTIPPLFEHLRAGALCCIGIHAEHFAELGFADMFRQQQAKNIITEPELVRVPIYAECEHEHAQETAWVVRFRVTES